MKAVTEAFANGVFGRPEDLAAAIALSKSVEDNKDRIGGVTGSDTFRSFVRTIDAKTKGQTEFREPIAGTSPEGYEALYDFRRLVTDWVVRNPNATTEEAEESVNRLGKLILDSLRPGPDSDPDDPATLFSNYERPHNLGFGNPFTDGDAPAPTPSPEERAATRHRQGEARGKALGKAFDRLAPEQQKALRDRAEKLKVSPEELLGLLLKRRIAEPQPAPTPDQN